MSDPNPKYCPECNSDDLEVDSAHAQNQQLLFQRTIY